MLRAEIDALRDGRHRAALRQRAAARPRGLRLARRLHPRRGDRADRVHGGPPRRAAQQAAVPRQLRPVRPADADQLGRDVRRRAGHPPAWRRVVGRAGLSERSAGSSSPSPAMSRSPACTACRWAPRPRADRPGRRGARRRGAARLTARRRKVEVPRPRQPDVPLDFPPSPRPDRCSAPGAVVVVAAGTNLLAAGDERATLLPQRVSVRQVRPLPRRVRDKAPEILTEVLEQGLGPADAVDEHVTEAHQRGGRSG